MMADKVNVRDGVRENSTPYCIQMPVTIILGYLDLNVKADI